MAYTLSDAKDDASDFVQAEQPSNPYDRAAEWGFSREHQRHRVTAAAVWRLPFEDGAGASVARRILGGWTLGASFRYRSGVPANVTVGSDVNADGNISDRPFISGVMAERNSFESGDSLVLDLRLSRRLRLGGERSLELIAEAFNVTNRVNFQSPNTVWGTELEPRSTFGEFGGAGDPRQVQVGVKFAF